VKTNSLNGGFGPPDQKVAQTTPGADASANNVQIANCIKAAASSVVPPNRLMSVHVHARRQPTAE
jgi:hypothetical protein